MIQFGMPTLIQLSNIEENIKLCKSLKLSFIELNMNLPQFQYYNIDIAKFKKLADENSIFFTLHLDDNINIADFNAKISKAYKRTVLEVIKIAKKLNISTINMHMSKGVYFTLPNEKIYLFDKYKDLYLKSIKSFQKVCESKIGKKGIKINIENTDGFTNFQKSAIEILLESPVFSLTLDIGHNHLAGYADEPFILNNLKKLSHFHLHDAIGNINHLSLGTGEVNLEKYISIMKKCECTAVIETKTALLLKESMSYINGVLGRKS